MMKKNPLIIIAFSVLLLAWACQNDNSFHPGYTTLKIRMTDGPGDFQQINVDVQEVLVKTSYDTSNWLALPTNAGVYNLLDFQNGVDTLLASGPVPAVVLQEVRLVVGPSSTVMQDSVLHNLETPSAEQSGLKIKIDRALSYTVDSILLDLDAAKSVHVTGSGAFILKPVIRIKS